jgi:hypothetical protein
VGAAPAGYFVDRNLGNRVPLSAVGALDPDPRLFLQRVPARLVLLPQAELASCDLELAAAGPDIEDFVVACGQMLVELLRDSKPCHDVARSARQIASRSAPSGSGARSSSAAAGVPRHQRRGSSCEGPDRATDCP